MLRKFSRFVRLTSCIKSLPNAENSLNPLKCQQYLNAFKYYCTSQTVVEEKHASIVDIKEIANGDETLEKKLKVLQLEIDVFRQEGLPVPLPESIKKEHWQDILNLSTRSARRRFYEFLFKTEKRKENKKARKEQKAKAWEETLKAKTENPEPDDGHIKYGLMNNTIFIRIYESTMNMMYNNRLVQAMQFGQKIVLDCGYTEHMNRMETMNCAKQLMLLFGENRAHDDPFDVHYCNADPNSKLIESFNKHIPQLYEKWFPINIHQESYLDLYPKDKIVYLTPHCRQELLEYDHDTIYVVGAMVDKVNNQPLSLAKAKNEGLKMARLPLDRYLQWGSGSGKSLTLNQVIAILLDVKKTGDWEFALRHVPRRKVIDTTIRLDSRHTLSYDRDSDTRRRDANFDLDRLRFRNRNKSKSPYCR